MRNICVFGSSSEKIDRRYLDSAESLGGAIARRGMGVVFGGGKYGVMGAVARGAASERGALIGVSPSFFIELDVLVDKAEIENYEEIFTETMRERKGVMEDRADAFVICAGGIGTFEEFFEVLTLKQLGQHNKPIIIYNVAGYYDPMIDLMNSGISERFLSDDVHMLYTVAETEEEVFDQLENYTPYQYNKYD